MVSDRALKTIISVGAIVIALLIVGIMIIWFMVRSSITVITSDRIIDGDYEVRKGEALVLKNGATLTVRGDLEVKGKMMCDEGSFLTFVEGDLMIENTVECLSKDRNVIDDIAFVVRGAVNITADAVMVAGGSLQIVDDPSKLAQTDAEKEALFNEVGQEQTGGMQLGPLTSSSNGSISVNSGDITTVSKLANLGHLFASPANAQASMRVVIGGKLVIGTGDEPPARIDARLTEEEKKKKPRKVILNFDFSDSVGVSLQNLTVSGPDGGDGSAGSGSCTVTGSDGNDAMRFRGSAGDLVINNFTLNLGNGGNGGDATTSEDCDAASATAGNGGKPGNFRISASKNFEIVGGFNIVPGVGGYGGIATATTKNKQNACPGENSGDAFAKGGNGGNSAQNLSGTGSIGGTSNISIATAFGGDGGAATATAGSAGNGTECGCAGGKGGKATAIGGKGGDAVSGSSKNEGVGGNGGDATAKGGDAGTGGSCEINEGPGGEGGTGGDAKATEGKAGNGDEPGDDGQKLQEAGGNGGDGGAGCMPGAGGSGGPGDQEGIDGEEGENTCVGEEPQTAISIGTDPTSPYEIQVISFGGSYIPIFLLRMSGADACKEDHWHSGTVKMLNGQTTSDPKPKECGLGKKSEKPIMKVSVDHDYMVELYGDAVLEHVAPKGAGTAPPPVVQTPDLDFGIRIEGGIFGN